MGCARRRAVLALRRRDVHSYTHFRRGDNPVDSASSHSAVLPDRLHVVVLFHDGAFDDSQAHEVRAFFLRLGPWLAHVLGALRPVDILAALVPPAHHSRYHQELFLRDDAVYRSRPSRLDGEPVHHGVPSHNGWEQVALLLPQHEFYRLVSAAHPCGFRPVWHIRAALPAALCPVRLRRLLRRHKELLSGLTNTAFPVKRLAATIEDLSARQESIRLRKSDGFMISRPRNPFRASRSSSPLHTIFARPPKAHAIMASSSGSRQT